MLAPSPQSKILASAPGGVLRFASACMLLAALWLLPKGGATFALYGGALGALALQGFAIALAGKTGVSRSGTRGAGAAFAVDFAALTALGLAAAPDLPIWTAPQNALDLLRLSHPGVLVSAGLYLAAAVIALTRGARLGLASSLALFLLPFLFNLLLALGSPLLERAAAALFGGQALPLARVVLRGALLFVVNEAIVHGACVAMGRRLGPGTRLHLILLLSAFAAAATPPFAAFGSLAEVAGLFPPLRILIAALAAALAQAGLWAQVYLATGVLGDILHDAPPVAPKLYFYWRSGAGKGAVYGFVFVALLLAVQSFIAQPDAVAVFLGSGAIGAALAGVALFPLARTILESTDSTPPFVKRLSRAYQGAGNFVCGAIVGVGLLIAFRQDLPAAFGGERFLFGFAFGALAYVGALLYRDFSDMAAGLRKKIRGWRDYSLGVLVGGVVGGAVGWYFDVGQLAVVKAHFNDHVTVNYAAAGGAEIPYAITPFFSKWGATNLGLVDGGVKLFYLESLSGVIQWIFAAPLFSVNLFFLTALLKRDLAPIRELFSAEGVRKLADNAIVVLRWGLWMAPIIYAFLKVAPDPTWYNQDGLIRTGVAAYMNTALPPSQFRDWSLSVFTALLTYDWLRVLIWFDHMGLRVATLVNLSFVGGDMADESAARFLGARGRSRAIPEAVRRFGTWAPLLIPFYIPRGAEWDKAWAAAEAAQKAGTTPVISLLLGYGLFLLGLCLALTIFMLTRPGAKARGFASSVLGNGLLSLDLWPDGQSFLRVETAARQGPPIDMTRAFEDPITPRGAFVYFSEAPEHHAPRLWSLAMAPTGRGFGAFAATSPVEASLNGEQYALRCEAKVEMAAGESLALWRIKLTNLASTSRKLRIASYREWVMNEGGVERRDAAYNGLHVGTVFARRLGAIFARNRLLKNQAGDFAGKRLSREIAFHAVRQSDDVRLIGYEDVRAQFFGLGQRRGPDSLTHGSSLRDPADQGLLYGFDPCAALALEVDLPVDGAVELTYLDGWAPDETAAAQAIERHLGAALPPEALAEIFAQTRALTPAAAGGGERFAFSPDGRELRTAPGAPRPFAHVMAGPHGLGAVATHDGDIFAFYRNARANSLTPFRMGEGRNAPPGQAIFVVEKETGEVHAATLLPLRRPDTRYDARFGRGAVLYTSESARLGLEQILLIAPDEPAQLLLLTLHNRTDREQIYRIAPMLEIVLAETPPDSLGALQAETDPSGKALYFANPRNEFVGGWAFVSTSLDADCSEFARARILGRLKADARVPYLAEHGHADAGAVDDGRRAAGFSGMITLAPGGSAQICVALGAAATLEAAQAFAARASEVAFAREKLGLLENFWDETLGALRIETSRPEFDRLVNDWLPYQLLTARLWGRTGPSQRSGAFGFRDQLQDVLPLILLAPELARRQILLHGSQQFVEGDVLKWWHEAPQGGVAIGERTHASDPHLWLPYVTARYVAATGDRAILDEILPFVEGAPVPPGVEGHVISPLPSRERASLLEHCLRAIQHTLDRFGAHGLPLMGAGDWDDGMNLVGFRGRGESVWVGFFLFDILTRFVVLAEAQGLHGQAEAFRARALNLEAALDLCWRGDRFVRAFADDGSEFRPLGAMSSAWPALSGAASGEKGREALENGLAGLDKGDRVLLVTPPYDENSKPFPGRSADYPPGVRENGGQYSHGSSWFVDALVRLGETASAEGDEAQARKDFSRAFEVWLSLSPLTKTGPEKIDFYGLPPHQQPADVYDGPGYAGRGGWSWYSGAAARMTSAAHALLGLRLEEGELKLRPDAFDDKGGLRLKSVTFRGKTFVASEKAADLIQE
ncbi:glycosyl transferase family 36 [uncultured Rhodoblastus sp.]|uniref:GH36-type glycosyl hydrolase domain-containing protein n=1 Tax=uncultured Rhodoblastus sp. TaxID=543037 RepID=UPI0025F0021C|nr:glycosyl transferase family 36 [uncultured Rhodoblastus sp.]